MNESRLHFVLFSLRKLLRVRVPKGPQCGYTVLAYRLCPITTSKMAVKEQKHLFTSIQTSYSDKNLSMEYNLVFIKRFIIYTFDC